MKNILILFLMASTLFAGTIKLTQTIQVKDSPFWKTSKKVGVLTNGTVLEYTDVFGDYARVEVVEGETKKLTSDHIGLKGFMSTGGLAVSNKVDVTLVTVEGWCLRSSPKNLGAENKLCGVGPGKTVEITEVMVTWYKVGPGRWVSAKYAEEQ